MKPDLNSRELLAKEEVSAEVTEGNQNKNTLKRGVFVFNENNI